MKTAAFHILRVGTAITFLWIGILILKTPESWGGLIQPWAQHLLILPLKTVMIVTAILDLAVGVLLLIDWWTWVAGLIGAFHILMVLVVVGINDITVRDIGLFAAALALMFDRLPPRLTAWWQTDSKEI